MKPDNEAPEVVFTWLQNRGYESLSAAERSTVLNYFTREEYDNMHEATNLLRNEHRVRKELVMEAFDRRHQTSITRLPGNWSWKLAAALMPIGLIAAVFLLKQGSVIPGVASNQTADTVYINKEIVGPKEVIHDTVYLIRHVRQQKQKESRQAQRPVKSVTLTMEEMQAFSAAELQTLIQENRGNSLEDDTLWRSFEAAPL